MSFLEHENALLAAGELPPVPGIVLAGRPQELNSHIAINRINVFVIVLPYNNIVKVLCSLFHVLYQMTRVVLSIPTYL